MDNISFFLSFSFTINRSKPKIDHLHMDKNQMDSNKIDMIQYVFGKICLFVIYADLIFLLVSISFPFGFY